MIDAPADLVPVTCTELAAMPPATEAYLRSRDALYAVTLLDNKADANMLFSLRCAKPAFRVAVQGDSIFYVRRA